MLHEGKGKLGLILSFENQKKISLPVKMLLLLSSARQKMFELEKKIIIKGVTMPDGLVPNFL